MDSGSVKALDLRLGFLIAFYGMLIVYTPLLSEISGRVFGYIGFWDRLKELPGVFQLLLVVSMFIGVGLIAESLRGIIDGMLDFLYKTVRSNSP